MSLNKKVSNFSNYIAPFKTNVKTLLYKRIKNKGITYHYSTTSQNYRDIARLPFCLILTTQGPHRLIFFTTTLQSISSKKSEKYKGLTQNKILRII